MNDDKNRATEQQSADRRVGEAVWLDGNSAAGILSEVFALDITTSRAMCAGCGTIRPLGALPLYGQNMGAVMRCPTVMRLCCAWRARGGECGSIRQEQGSW